MKYVCQTVPLNRLIVTPMGQVESKCQTCRTRDCSHDIEYREVSVFGINRRMRCLIRGGEPHLVAACQGYTD